MPKEKSHNEGRQQLEEVELVLQYLSNPENLTSPDSEHVRAITAQYALDRLHEFIEDIPFA